MGLTRLLAVRDTRAGDHAEFRRSPSWQSSSPSNARFPVGRIGGNQSVRPTLDRCGGLRVPVLIDDSGPFSLIVDTASPVAKRNRVYGGARAPSAGRG